MPYYEEWYHNDSIANWSYENLAGTTSRHSGFANVDLVRIKTYRTRPRSSGKIIVSSEIPSATADPYCTFMDTERLKRSTAIARGFDSSLFQEDRGHPFELLRFKSEGPLWSGTFKNTSPILRDYRGANLDLREPDDGSVIPYGFAPIGWSDLESYAQSAYAKAAPTPAVFQLSTFLGELREGLPRLGFQLFSKAASFKSLGDDYLNVAFGWKPFISDVQNAAQALMGATTALLGPRGPLHRLRSEDVQFASRSENRGQRLLYPTTWIRGSTTTRNANELSQMMVKLTADQSPNGIGGSSGNSLYGNVILSERTESERWFEGSFTFIPKIGFNADSYVDRLSQLVQTDITPSVLWELAPWSWLIDWFVKIGDSIAANEVASDNRILSNYAYAMERREINRACIAYSLNGPTYAGPSTIARSWTTSGKRRIRANPYGFKPMTAGGFNTNQWLIMAALGLARIQ